MHPVGTRETYPFFEIVVRMVLELDSCLIGRLSFGLQECRERVREQEGHFCFIQDRLEWRGEDEIEVR